MKKIPDRKQIKLEFETMTEQSVDIEVTMTPEIAFGVMMALQIAAGHPDFPEPSLTVVKVLSQSIQKQLVIGPALAEVVNRGWVTKYPAGLNGYTN